MEATVHQTTATVPSSCAYNSDSHIYLTLKGLAVTQISTSSYDILADSNRMVALLERYRTDLPFVDKELTLHQSLRHELETHQRAGERSLAEWRQALARRWECEIAGQRFYMHMHRQLCDYFGADSPYLKIMLPDNTRSARTAVELLNDLRRLQASLEILQPQPPFVCLELPALTQVCTDLEEALNWTQRCEAQRRTAMLEQRLAHNVYYHARAQTQRLLNEYIGCGQEAQLANADVDDLDDLEVSMHDGRRGMTTTM